VDTPDADAANGSIAPATLIWRRNARRSIAPGDGSTGAVGSGAIRSHTRSINRPSRRPAPPSRYPRSASAWLLNQIGPIQPTIGPCSAGMPSTARALTSCRTSSTSQATPASASGHSIQRTPPSA
jgi:hypothetical protein